MAHILVEQLKFARQKWMEGLEGVSQEEGFKRFGQMNSIGWMVGHLASFEQFLWLELAQEKIVSQAVKTCSFGKPASTPPLDEMTADWNEIVAIADAYLDTLTDKELAITPSWKGKPLHENIGTFILRQTWHYWYHLGEMQSIRQMLGHQNLPPFVGAISPDAGFSLE